MRAAIAGGPYRPRPVAPDEFPLGRYARLTMATDKRPAPSRRTGGRVTPKGGPTKKSTHATHEGPAASTRYTPRSGTVHAPSPTWLPILMIALCVIGLLVIFLHYVDLLLPGAASKGPAASQDGTAVCFPGQPAGTPASCVRIDEVSAPQG